MLKRIVVSGATGAIGIALIQYSLERGMQVLAVCHRNSERITRLPQADNLQILELSTEEYAEFVKNDEKLSVLGEMI